MDNYYINHDFKWMMQRNLPVDYGPKLSQVRIHRFNEYNEFSSVLQSLFGGHYDGSVTMKFSRIVFTNLLGDEAYNYLMTAGPLLPIKLQEVMLRHGSILNPNQKFETTTTLNAEESYNRGNTSLELGNNIEALSNFTKAIELNPNFYEAYNDRSVVKFYLKDYEGSINDCNRAIKLNPNFAEAYNNRGNALLEFDKFSEAIHNFNKAIDLNPNLASAYANRGLANFYLKNYLDTINDCNKAIALNPNSAIAYYYRGSAKLNLRDNSNYCADWGKAAKLGLSLASDLFERYCK